MPKNFTRAAFVLPLLLLACAVDESPVGGGTSNLVAEGGALDNHVTVFADRLEFDPEARDWLGKSEIRAKIESYAQAPSTAEPVFLVGKPQADALAADGSIKADVRNPRGYLRRAVGIEDGPRGAIVVKTEPATMAEAVEEIKQRGILEVGDGGDVKPGDIQPLDNGDNTARGWGNTNKTWHSQIGPAGGYVVLDVSGKQLWKHDLMTGGGAEVRLADGKITIAPSVDVHLEVNRFIPKAVSAEITADVHGTLSFLAEAQGAFDLDQGDVLYTKTFGTSLKGLPLSLDIEVKWACTLGATAKSTATFGATAATTLHGGLSWDGDVKPVFDRPVPTFERLGPTIDSGAHLGGNCHLVSTVTMHVFDESGPMVTADLYANLDADASNAQATGTGHAVLKAGLNAEAGGTLNPFGFKIADVHMPPYNYEKELFNQDFNVGK